MVYEPGPTATSIKGMMDRESSGGKGSSIEWLHERIHTEQVCVMHHVIAMTWTRANPSSAVNPFVLLRNGKIRKERGSGDRRYVRRKGTNNSGINGKEVTMMLQEIHSIQSCVKRYKENENNHGRKKTRALFACPAGHKWVCWTHFLETRPQVLWSMFHRHYKTRCSDLDGSADADD